MGWTRRLSARSRMLPQSRPARADLAANAAAGLRVVAAADAPGPGSDTLEFVRMLYRVLLQREAEPAGLHNWAERLDAGALSRDQLVMLFTRSEEFCAIQQKHETDEIRARRLLEAIHASRLQLVRQLPKADTIVDLGGSWESRPEGALVFMGYPYPFQRLTIVDLPRSERHEVYAEISGEYTETIATRLGPVNYIYTSLAQLNAFADASVDFVYSGQSIEHVTREDAARACQEVRRVLKPGGSFCLDTPNRTVTALQSPHAFINPDHKHEYTHAELSRLLERQGFIIREAKGLNLAAQSVARGEFLADELVANVGLYDDIVNCYLLYYRCQKA